MCRFFCFNFDGKRERERGKKRARETPIKLPNILSYSIKIKIKQYIFFGQN